MRMRDRSAIVLIILAVVLFAVIWPINNEISNPDTWHSHVVKDQYGKFKGWRPPRNEGETFFNSVFRGGGGTPAILAMFGGQRYMIANIMWNYSDILFHQSGDDKRKLFQMADALEATVTLNPAFTEAWSVYGWHLAWNLTSEVTDFVLKAQYLQDGENVYLRAITANPNKPRPYFDLAWLYLQREFDYNRSKVYLEYMVNNFTPQTAKKGTDPLEEDRHWDPKVVGHRLAYVYKKLGIAYKDWDYIQRSMDMYQKCIDVEPTDTTAQANLNMLKKHFHDTAWMTEEIRKEDLLRKNFGVMSLEEYAKDNAPSPLAAEEFGGKQEENAH